MCRQMRALRWLGPGKDSEGRVTRAARGVLVSQRSRIAAGSTRMCRQMRALRRPGPGRVALREQHGASGHGACLAAIATQSWCHKHAPPDAARSVARMSVSHGRRGRVYHEDRLGMTTLVIAQRLRGFSSAWLYSNRERWWHKMPVLDRPGNVHIPRGEVDNGPTRRIARAGPPSGRPVQRSGGGGRFGKNGLVPTP